MKENNPNNLLISVSFTNVRKQWENGEISSTEYHQWVIANIHNLSQAEMQTFIIDAFSFV